MGQRLERLRNAKELSQSEVARALNLTQQAIDNYEKGAREPKGSILVRLAQFYGVTTDYLLGQADDPHGKADPDTARAVPPVDDDPLVYMFRAKLARLLPHEREMVRAWLEKDDGDSETPNKHK